MTGPAALEEIRQTVLDLRRLLLEQASDRDTYHTAVAAFQNRYRGSSIS